MSWHKITFNDDQIMHGEVADLLPQVQNIFIATQTQKDFCVFEEDTFENERIGNSIYFSPVASSHCVELLFAHGGKKCEKPTLSEDLSGCVGERKCSRLLMQNL